MTTKLTDMSSEEILNLAKSKSQPLPLPIEQTAIEPVGEPEPITEPKAQPFEIVQAQAQPDAFVLEGNAFESNKSFELAQRMAKLLCSSSLVPSRFQGPQNLGSALIALNMAQRMKADPLMTMQNLYVVHGNPCFSSQFMIAIFNKTGRYSTIKYEFGGKEGDDSWKCRAYATEFSTGEVAHGPWVSVAMAKAEGWWGKNGSKWPNMTELMLRYRAGTFFVRTTAPEIGMGMQTHEEMLDVYEPPLKAEKSDFMEVN
jgi:hypothetical protein